jgi:GDPmannose 4,6-dehydratase
MWLMLQADEPGDYVVATGQMISAGEFARRVFARLSLPADRHLRYDERYLRAAEVDALQGDAGKARDALGWSPRRTVDDLIEDMVASDLELARRERLIRDSGPQTDAPAWSERWAS